MLTEIDPLNDERSLVRLERVSGADIDVVNSARVSHAKKVDAMTERDEKLMRFLIEHKHETPFEHNQLVFEVKAPGGKDIELEFYLPVRMRRQSKSNRQASGESFVDESLTLAVLATYSASAGAYRKLIENGVARELARVVLPVGMYSSMWATCNLRSLMHFLDLRLSSDAQFEIRQYAKAMLKLAEQHFPVTMSLWRELHGYNSDGEKG